MFEHASEHAIIVPATGGKDSGVHDSFLGSTDYSPLSAAGFDPSLDLACRLAGGCAFFASTSGPFTSVGRFRLVARCDAERLLFEGTLLSVLGGAALAVAGVELLA
jgi:hypothetical protein